MSRARKMVTAYLAMTLVSLILGSVALASSQAGVTLAFVAVATILLALAFRARAVARRQEAQ